MWRKSPGKYSSLTRVIRRSRSPSPVMARKRSRESSFSISPSPPHSEDRNLNLMRHASERIRVQRRSKDINSRERSFERQRSPLISESKRMKQIRQSKYKWHAVSSSREKDVQEQKHHKHDDKHLNLDKHEKLGDKSVLDKREIIIQTNMSQADEPFMDPSTCSFQATFKEKTPELVFEPSRVKIPQRTNKDPTIKVRFNSTFASLNDLEKSKEKNLPHFKNKKHMVEPTFDYMVDDQGQSSVTSIQNIDDNKKWTEVQEKNSKSDARDRDPGYRKSTNTREGNQNIQGQKHVKASQPEENKTQDDGPENDRIRRLEKLVELLVNNNVNKQIEPKPKRVIHDEDIDGISLVPKSISVPSRGFPELIPSNPKFTVSMWLNRIQEISLERQFDENTSIEFVKSQMTGIIKSWFKTVSSYDFTWPELRLLIIKSFPDNMEFATTLKLLVNRIKESSETINQYYFSKMYLCECCKITGENAVSCLIDGLNNPFTKQEIKSHNFLTPEALYSEYLSKYPDEISNTPKMENRIVEESYEPEHVFEEEHEVEDKDYRMPPGPPPFRISKKKKCFTCNRKGHIASECRLSQPQVCYNCNRIGHIKAECTLFSGKVTFISENKEYEVLSSSATNCELNGFHMWALIDTGSSVTTITESVVKEVGALMTFSHRVLHGYGGGTTQVLGEARVRLKVDRVEADVLAMVVSNDVQAFSVIIGQSFLNRGDVILVIQRNHVQLYPLDDQIMAN